MTAETRRVPWRSTLEALDVVERLVAPPATTPNYQFAPGVQPGQRGQCGWRAETPRPPWGLHPRPGHLRTTGARRPRQHRLPKQPGALPRQRRRGAARPRRPRGRPRGLHPRPGIRERLAPADPDHTDYQNKLAVSLDKLVMCGGARRPRGRPSGLHPRPADRRTTGQRRPDAPTTKAAWRASPQRSPMCGATAETPRPPSRLTPAPWTSANDWPPPTPTTPTTKATWRSPWKRWGTCAAPEGPRRRLAGLHPRPGHPRTTGARRPRQHALPAQPDNQPRQAW